MHRDGLDHITEVLTDLLPAALPQKVPWIQTTPAMSTEVAGCCRRGDIDSSVVCTVESTFPRGTVFLIPTNNQRMSISEDEMTTVTCLQYIIGTGNLLKSGVFSQMLAVDHMEVSNPWGYPQ